MTRLSRYMIKFGIKHLIASASILLLATTACAATRSPKGAISRNLDIFNALYKELQTQYVDTIDAEKSINTAITAMLSEIDPYTEYMPADDQDDFLKITTGEYGGIGSYIQQRDNGVCISEPFEGSPAQRAGLRAGDRILMIDNDSVSGWTHSKVSDRLRGQAGTELTVMVERPYVQDSIITVKMTRQKIQTPAVPYYGVINDGHTGYISLTQFTDKAAQEVRDALLALKKDPNVTSLILDLQGNGGGLLDAAVKIVGLFVPKNTEVLRTRGKGLLNEKIYKTTSAPVDPDIPLVVLVDGGSASSAEIVTGALQDLDRAVVVGSRSFGKGLVQTTRPLPYDGLLKVTTGKYYIPSGRLIQAIDYSHRNPDGSVARIPDSLTNVFHTAHGREVRDGGGITPDVKAEYNQLNRLTYNIMRDNWAFDYATRYAANHPKIGPARTFTINDSIFADFKTFIDPDKFKYDKVCETMIKNLREAAETEGYMNDSVSAQLATLERMLKHNLNHDLDQNRNSINMLLSDEIVKRYYYQRGHVENYLQWDAAVDSAISILNNPERYRSILAPAGAK